MVAAGEMRSGDEGEATGFAFDGKIAVLGTALWAGVACAFQFTFWVVQVAEISRIVARLEQNIVEKLTSCCGS